MADEGWMGWGGDRPPSTSPTRPPRPEVNPRARRARAGGLCPLSLCCTEVDPLFVIRVQCNSFHPGDRAQARDFAGGCSFRGEAAYVQYIPADHHCSHRRRCAKGGGQPAQGSTAGADECRGSRHEERKQSPLGDTATARSCRHFMDPHHSSSLPH